MSQSITQFANEVGRSRDTVTRAIASLGLEVAKPQPGKAAQLSPIVQEELRKHFGAYPQVGHIREAAPPPSAQVAELDPRVIKALQLIHQSNLQAHQETRMQITGLTHLVESLQAELQETIVMVRDMQTYGIQQRLEMEPTAPRRSFPIAPMTIAAAVLIGLVGVWFTWQSPHPQTQDGLRESAQSELYQ
jgi:DNA-binding transcriptional MocR family regulator